MSQGSSSASITFLTNLDKEEIDSRLADLEYVPIKITSFNNNVGTVEIGRIISSVTFNWVLNKEAKTITLGGESMMSDVKQVTLENLSLSTNKTWTLKVTDERDLAVTSNTSITFLNGAYHGVAADVETIDSAFILGLTKTLTGSRARTINITAGSDQYIYYCVPTRFGNCNFNVGGFDGGFEKVSTLDFTNASGYTESYDVYKSTNSGLGSTAVKIT